MSGAALVYFGSALKDFENKPFDLLTKKGMQVPFEVKTHSVDVDLDELATLLKVFKKYADLDSLPDGLDGCKNCKLIDRMSFAPTSNSATIDGMILPLRHSSWQKPTCCPRTYVSIDD